MRFRFETLLRLRKNQENLLQRDLGTINTHLYRQQQNLENLETITAQSKENYTAGLTQQPDLRLMALYDQFFQFSRTNRAKQTRIVAEIQTRADSKRQDLAEAMKRRRIFEILKERQWMEYKKEQQRLETVFLDEVAGSRRKGEFS